MTQHTNAGIDGSRGRDDGTRRVRSRWRITAFLLCILVFALVVVIPAVARSGDSTPSRPDIHADAARLVDRITTSSKRTVEVSIAPSSRGEDCLLLTVPDDVRSRAGGACLNLDAQRHPMFVTINWIRNDQGSFDVVAAGMTRRQSGIKMLRLDSSLSGTSGVVVTPHHGAFGVSLATVDSPGELSDESFKIVGIGENGTEVATVDLKTLIDLARPK